MRLDALSSETVPAVVRFDSSLGATAPLLVRLPVGSDDMVGSERIKAAAQSQQTGRALGSPPTHLQSGPVACPHPFLSSPEERLARGSLTFQRLCIVRCGNLWMANGDSTLCDFGCFLFGTLPSPLIFALVAVTMCNDEMTLDSLSIGGWPR